MTEPRADRGQPLAILAVDDEPAVLELVRRALDDTRIGLTAAAGGPAALRHFESGAAVDLLITDLRMPEMPGDELARLARAGRPDLRVLFLTGHAGSLFAPALQLQADDAYLDKPFTRAGLRQAVAQVLFGTTALGVTPDPDKAHHDFKNKLAIIRGFSDILLTETGADDPRRHDLEEIRTAAVSALELLATIYPEADSGGP
jgi:CheY-like chemotaxis protein